MKSRAHPEPEVEQSVRDRLYGERAAVTPMPAPYRPRRPGPGDIFGGRYRVLELIGVGGMATVYRAWDELLKRDVAIKVIAEHLIRDPLAVRRLREEAELCARLAHPNIVLVLDAGSAPRAFIVMEFVHGVDVGTLARRARLTAKQTIHVVAQVCDALAYVHDQGVVHHDVAPRNILIRRPDGTAKLIDFGLAPSAAGAGESGEPNVMGTPGYVAPEIVNGARPSPRSDLYSLGAVAYRLLAGPSGLLPRDPRATVPQRTAVPGMPPLAEVRPDLPDRLIAAVEQAVSRDPAERQGSVAQFGAQLVEAHRVVSRPARPRELFPELTELLPEPIRGELPSAA